MSLAWWLNRSIENDCKKDEPTYPEMWAEHWRRPWLIDRHQRLAFYTGRQYGKSLYEHHLDAMTYGLSDQVIYLDPVDRRPVVFGSNFDFKYRPHWALIEKKEAEGMKKDIGMNKATIQALHKSIAHWNDICYGSNNDLGPTSCALCNKFYSGGCLGCPINESGFRCISGDSVYGRYHRKVAPTNLLHPNGFCTVDSADAAEAMLELLVSLLPDGEQRDYNTRVYLKVGATFNYVVETGDPCPNHVKLTGITTDGRNAFPQAKYVWERVFEYQVCGPIPEMPSYEWVADLPRASFIWSWPEAKTKDGKCVTCGQVVKKKVTKYKVLLQGRISGDICISDHYFASKSEFETALPNLRCIQLILETAKEFDA